MGASVEQVLLAANDAKLHGGLCMKLGRLASKIVKIFPSLEAVQPRCMPGIQSLCALHLALDKATALLQYCAECSKLYLAVTGDSILAKFTRIKGSLAQNLSHLQSMVPRNLAKQIAEIVEELEEMTFALEPSEMEIGIDIIALLQHSSGSWDDTSQLEVFHQVANRLGIISPKAVLTERRALKKLLDKAQAEVDQKKVSIVKYLLNILRKYAMVSYISLDNGSRNSDPCLEPGREIASEVSVESKDDQYGSRHWSFNLAAKGTNSSSGGAPVPPEEYRCPISLQLMSDPVVIASGQTYERACIEKWFSENHDTCPKSQQKLSHLSITPNYCIKGLIVSWCEKHGVKVPDPITRPLPTSPLRLDPSDSVDITYQHDDSVKEIKMSPSEDNQDACILKEDDDDITTGHLGVNYHCDSIFLQENEESSKMSDTSVSRPCDMIKSENTDEDDCSKYERLLTSLTTPPLESQSRAVEEVKCLSEDDDKACCNIVASGLIPPIVSFLRLAIDASDIKAQKIGALALLNVAKVDRNKIMIVSAGALPILLDLIHSEITEIAVAVLLTLSSLDDNKASFVSSGVIPLLLELLESRYEHCRHDALNILYNLLTIFWKWSNMLSVASVSELVGLFGDSELRGKCISILNNLAGTEEGRAVIAGTEGCVLAMAELLDTGTSEEQEQAANILLLLCTNSFEHSQLVLREGVIPSLVHISVDGSPDGRDKALKLLEHFREQRFKDYSWKSSPKVVYSTMTSFNEESSSIKTRKSLIQTSKKSAGKKNFLSKLSSLFSTCIGKS